jgi:signal transduction histidine kinase
VDGVNTGVLSGYIAKPWEPVDVEMTLRTAIERHLLAVRLRARNQELSHLNLDLERKVEERTKQLQLTVTELNAVNEQLAELNRIKDEFVSICSHDLKSPISALTGFIDLIELRMSRVHPRDGFEDTFQSIREVLGEMSALVNHILDLSRLESGKDELRLSVAQLSEPLNRALSISKSLAASKGVLLNVESRPELPFMHIDVERMTQVVTNLLSNAVKFTEPGGTISIRLGIDEDDHQFLEIADTGIGMTQEACESVFSEGSRHLRPGTGGERSTGMGLAICRRIVEMHGGEITVRSTPGIGSVFRVTLNVSSKRDTHQDTGEGALVR